MRRPNRRESLLKALLQAEADQLRWEQTRKTTDLFYQGAPESELKRLREGRAAQDAWTAAHIENLRTMLAELEEDD